MVSVNVHRVIGIVFSPTRVHDRPSESFVTRSMTILTKDDDGPLQRTEIDLFAQDVDDLFPQLFNDESEYNAALGKLFAR